MVAHREPKPLNSLLHAAAAGDAEAGNAFFERVYSDLRAMAGAACGQEHGQLLQPTVLVHEAWLKLRDSLDQYEDQSHFFCTAARAMRQVLASHVRAIRSCKRDGRPLQLTTFSRVPDARVVSVDMLALHDSLTRLRELNARHADIVELRFFCSLTIPQTAQALDVSHGTVESAWAMARAWLRLELAADELS